MATSIRLFRGAFGHVSVLNVESDFVTHAHPEAHIIVWIEGAAGRMTIGDGAVHLGAGMAAAINPLEPHSHDLACEGRAGLFLAFYIDPAWARLRRGLSSGAPLFVEPTIPLEPWLHRAAASLLDQLCDDYGLDDLASVGISAVNPDLFLAARLTRDAFSTVIDLFVERQLNPPTTPAQFHAAIAKNHPRLFAAHADL